MAKLFSTNPGRACEVIGELEQSTQQEIKSRVDNARQATASWGGMGVDARVKILKSLVEALKNNKEELAAMASSEMGMPILDSRGDIDDALRYLNWYLDNAAECLAPEICYEDETTIHRVYKEPLGVVAVIVPWNYPMSNFVWGCGQNLVAGNTVVFKHSEECPLFGKLLEDIVCNILPKGVFGEVYGGAEVGRSLVHSEIDQISFTGSSKVGKQIYQLAADKFIRAVLEMGGSAPGIIFADADVDSTLEPIFFNRFFNAGQSCDALKRLIVHQSCEQEVIDKLATFLMTKKIGDPLDETTEIGPLVAKRQLDLLESQIQDAVQKGAKIIIGGRRPKGPSGAYYEPTILSNIHKDMRVWKEEVFGPVLPVVAFSTDEEAIELANDTEYGLGAYVFTSNKARAQKVASEIKTGMIAINSASYLYPASPFGGYKHSGMGREHGKYGFAEVTQLKVVAVDK